jgi:hypothetical protein
VIGAEKYVDWRLARIDTIDQYTREIKAARGAVGIAHPFALGSPICTGCRWDFKVRDWRHIDYVEVWSNPFPQRHLKNTLAFEWWTGLLNQGHRLGASAGWDWHRMPRDKPLPAATWLALEGGIINTGTVREALSAGRTIVTCGPLPEILLRRGDRLFYPGDSLDRGPANIRVTLDEGRRREIWGSFGIRCTRIALVQNGKTVKSFPPGENGPPEPELDLAPGWLRVEGYGDLQNEGGKLLFFTSPYYIL